MSKYWKCANEHCQTLNRDGFMGTKRCKKCSWEKPPIAPPELPPPPPQPVSIQQQEDGSAFAPPATQEEVDPLLQQLELLTDEVKYVGDKIVALSLVIAESFPQVKQKPKKRKKEEDDET